MNQQKQLTERFGINGVLVFRENESGLISAVVSTPTCTAEVYMQGAHLTHWQPVGHQPVLFLSEQSAFQPGKAIRGGVPLIFPWFGTRTATPFSDRTDGPSHGFARTSEWLLVEAGRSKDDFEMIFRLTDNDESRAVGFEGFNLTYKICVGSELELELIVENQSANSFQFEAAFHTYLMVSDVRRISVSGLQNIEYLDKTASFELKRQQEKLLHLDGETDRLYIDTEGHIEVHDSELKRVITVDKLNSQSSVIWNPWDQLSAKLSDMADDGWTRMLCVESANANKNAIVLPSGKHHTMHANVTVSAG
jgi:glucose-6-phosphate 1-epimerase